MNKHLFCVIGLLLALLLSCQEEEKPAPLLPLAEFNTSQSDSLANLLIEFENKSTNASSFIWDFGDGQSSTQKSPKHRYEQGGVYTVRLTALNKDGSDVMTRTVRVADVPLADFSFVRFDSLDTASRAPVEVIFKNLSVNADRYFWDFGDGHTSSQGHPIHRYEQGGTYTVSLAAYKGGRVHRTERSIAIREAQPMPFSAFEIIGGGCVAPCELSFVNNSKNASTYVWDFGDGTSSEVKEPSKRYAKGGFYTITLKATGAGGTDISTRSVNVIPRPVAKFIYTGGDCKAPCIVKFINLSENGEEYFWNFGDGTSSTDKEPECRYAKAGLYTVTLTVRAAGVSAETTQRIKIAE